VGTIILLTMKVEAVCLYVTYPTMRYHNTECDNHGYQILQYRSLHSSEAHLSARFVLVQFLLQVLSDTSLQFRITGKVRTVNT
jgi:regulator of sigma D